MKTNKEKIEALDFALDTRLSPEVKALLTGVNALGIRIETMSGQDARNVFATVQASVNVDLSGIEESEKTILIDGFTIKLNIVRPSGIKGKLPAFIFINGGGWIFGDYDTHKRLVRDLSVLSGCAAIFVNYTRSPEAPYPQAVHEVYAVTRWVAEHGEEINIDGKNIAIVGNSAGGNMSTVTTLLAKENNGPEIKLQVLMCPVVDTDFETGSYQQFGEQRFLTTSMMKWVFDIYAPDPNQRKDIHVSPLRATVEQLSGLPPALIITAENDVLRDEAEAYGRKLAEAGVAVTCIRYNGTIHDFGCLNALAETSQTKSSLIQVAAELKKYLHCD
ncbi:alpha/beta hydrolase [Mucilaginibacter sp. SG564]|uniref:alpha/beta hydrolase n=1 Tax=Mucilaginibacter sp. SG564 TaxID=2587022 RepID=UPI001552F06F|nr:alpha/beta hydrolase [Mucilaginibacter sp. SG564]NOW94999.1 acetyl esterase/lipase [Mucilaginibacter sp. SG564]